MNHDELKNELNGVVLSIIDCYGFDSLKTIRAIINGKLGKRTITKEQQKKMQLSRKQRGK